MLVRFNHRDIKALVLATESDCYLCRKFCYYLLNKLCVIRRDFHHRLARNSVLLRTAINRDDLSSRLFAEKREKSARELICVGSAVLYILSRMTAHKSANSKLNRLLVLSVCTLYIKGTIRAHATRTAYDEEYLICAVHIYHSSRKDATVIKRLRSVKSYLLRCGEKALNGGMTLESAVKHGKHYRNCDTVVSSKSRSSRSDISVLYKKVESVTVKIVLTADILLADHISVSLQKYRLSVLTACRRWKIYKNVLRVVCIIFKSSRLCELHQILGDLLLVIGSSRYRGYLLKMLKKCGMLKILADHIYYLPKNYFCGFLTPAGRRFFGRTFERSSIPSGILSIYSSALPVPLITQSSGFSATRVFIPVSSSISLSSP